MTWDTDDKGQVTAFPLVGWQTAAAGETLCVLQLRYAETSEQLVNGERSRLQLVISPDHAVELAEDLQKIAERLLTQKPGTLQN